MIYNIIVFLASIFSLPKWLFLKKYRGSLSQKMGWKLPPKANALRTIWIHMVSVGETRVMIPIYQKLRTQYPSYAIFLSSTSKTGHEEAKRSLTRADGYFYLPLDLSYLMRKLVFRIKPDLLLLSESDFWPNMVNEVKRGGGKVLLINGKISQKSQQRFQKVPIFSKRIFEAIDCYCIQNTEYADRFISLYVPKEKVTVTGNLKLSIPPRDYTREQLIRWKKKWRVEGNTPVITVGSTHEGEEEILLPHLRHYKVLLAPRHPERFNRVKKWLEASGYDNVTLVDQMGILGACYRVSQLAIIGGSFVPGIGGHNIFEPIQARIPVIFGPYMDTQKDLVDMILESNSGMQISATNLPDILEKSLTLQPNAEKLAGGGLTPFQITWSVLEPYLLR